MTATSSSSSNLMPKDGTLVSDSSELPTLEQTLLSNIFHPMPSSPIPVAAGERDVSPEPIAESEVLEIRRRLEEMGLWHSQSQNLSSREKELVDMVTRLVDPPPIDPAQLIRQAEMIASLTTQRDYLLQRAAEDRERWESERETWDRTAEALLAQSARPINIEEINTRERQIHDIEMRSLESKLAEAQRRQATLESELQKLKPLLFVQPYFIPRRDKGKAREVPITDGPDVDAAAPGKAAPPFKYHSSAQHRRRTHRSLKTYKNPKGTPLSADAYSEHLLLAMRKVGRTRATQVSGIIDYAERQNERIAKEQNVKQREQQQQLQPKGRQVNGSSSAAPYYRRSTDDMDVTDDGPPRAPPTIPPRTPVKSTVIHYGPRTTADNAPNMPIAFVYTNTPTPTSHRHHPPGSPHYTPAASSSHAAQGNNKSHQGGQGTPLDSLLDAVRMMGDGTNANASTKRNNGKGRARERDDEPESPVPSATTKRRRLSVNDNTNTNANLSVPSTTKPRGSTLGRVRSALDVLADQAAAAYDEPEQSDRRAAPNSNSNSTAASSSAHAGRGDDGEAESQPPVTVTVKPRGRGRPRGSVSMSSSSSTQRRDASVATSVSSASTVTATATATATAATPVMTSSSGRPIRQTRRAEHAGAGVGVGARGTGTGAGTGRPRGRPRGSTNVARGGGGGSGSMRVISTQPMAGTADTASRGTPSRDQQGEEAAAGGEGRGGDATGSSSSRSQSIAQEVLRHGYADASRFRLPSTSSAAAATSASTAAAPAPTTRGPSPDTDATTIERAGRGQQDHDDDLSVVLSRADNVDADMGGGALDAEAEARHNLPRGPSRPPDDG